MGIIVTSGPLAPSYESTAIMEPDIITAEERFAPYLSLVPESDLIGALEQQTLQTLTFVSGLSEDQLNRRCGEGKWSVREVFGHLVDIERVFGYRILVWARGEDRKIPRTDQELYVANARFQDVPIANLMAQYEHLRRSTILLLQSLPAEAWERKGSTSGVEMTVRQHARIVLGHERHHLELIRTKYLNL